MFAKRTNWNMTPNRLSEALAAHRAAGKPLLDLTISNPTEWRVRIRWRGNFGSAEKPGGVSL